MSKASQAELTEELARVDQELKLLQKELEDAVFMNDEFTKKNDIKEKELIDKDELVKSLRQKNTSELDILGLEYQSVVEKYNHEINSHTAEIRQLRTKKNRMSEIKLENEHLKESIVILHNSIDSSGRTHAIVLHEMNRDMKLLRQQMEAKLKKELAGLELAFQEEAFNALHLRQKKAMLENAKLKDEVTLQGVGIANLTARLMRQKMQQDKIRKQLQKLNVKSKKLRENLARATKTKNDLIVQKQTLLKEYSSLQEAKAHLMLSNFPEMNVANLNLNTVHELSSNSNSNISLSAKQITALSKTFSQLLARDNSDDWAHEDDDHSLNSTTLMAASMHDLALFNEEYSKAVYNYALWRERLERLQALHLEVRPLNVTEKRGGFQIESFPIKDVMACILSIDKVKELKSLPETELADYVVAKIREALLVDDDLRQALKAIVGKESKLLMAGIQQYLALVIDFDHHKNKALQSNQHHGDTQQQQESGAQSDDECDHGEDDDSNSIDLNEDDEEEDGNNQQSKAERKRKVRNSKKENDNDDDEQEDLNSYQNMTSWLTLKIVSLWDQPVSEKYISNHSSSSNTLPKPKTTSSGIASPSNWKSSIEELSDEDDSHYQETTKEIIGSYLNEYIHHRDGYEDEEEEEEEDDRRMKQAEWDAVMFDSSVENSKLLHKETPAVIGTSEDEVAATSWLLHPSPATMGAFATHIIANMKETKPKLVTPGNYQPPRDHQRSTTSLQYEIGPPLILYKNRPDSGHNHEHDLDGAANHKSKLHSSPAVTNHGLSRSVTQGTLNSHISKSSRGHPPSSPAGFEDNEITLHPSMKKSKQALSDPLMNTKFRRSTNSSHELSHKDLTHSNLPPALVRSMMKTSSLPSLPDIKKSKKSI